MAVTSSGVPATASRPLGGTLSEPRPVVAAAAVAALLADTYDVTGELTELHGERDLNFLVTQPSGERSILKIHNPAEPPAVVDMHAAALEHIAATAPELPVCRTIPTRTGEPRSLVRGTDGRRSIVRRLSYLPGRHVGREDLDGTQLFDWGRMTAALGRSLRGFVHPAAATAVEWDIRRFPTLHSWAAALRDDDRTTVLELLDRFDDRVAPQLSLLRAQVVHNDLSLGNVLVGDNGVISGITDFGDMTHTALVCDLAVSIADVLDGRDGSIELAPVMIAGYESITALEPEEAVLLADLVAARCATALTITAWRDQQAMSPPAIGAGARRLLGQLLAAGLDQVAASWANCAVESPAAPPAPRPSGPSRSTEDLLAARHRTLGPLALTYRVPLHVVRGEGVYLYGAAGERWLDAYNNVPVLGHCHPGVVAATADQLGRVNTNSRYLQQPVVELAEQLLAAMPAGHLDRVLLVNSGSEANDLAWRIARFATGRSGAVVTSFAYHGVTSVTTDLSPETWGEAPPPPNVRLVDPPTGAADPGSGIAGVVAELRDSGHGVAAMFVDGVFTSDGILGPAHSWTAAAVDAVHAAGGLYIADEVQAGHGRTGDHLWSWAASGLRPDLVTLGKPMGNGYPVAAVVGPASLIDPFIERTDYFSTYGGGTAACAAALAVLRAIDDEGVVANAKQSGEHLRASLDGLAARHPRLGARRGWGLAVGVDIVRPGDGELDPGCAQVIVDDLRDSGVLIGTTGRSGATLKIRPPLVFSRDDGDRLVSVLDGVLSARR
jgi:4-aminobutyrate aminotransferase-like enzyme/Ser/Thr protein kinase RdoA (MazF antagonist)